MKYALLLSSLLLVPLTMCGAGRAPAPAVMKAVPAAVAAFFQQSPAALVGAAPAAQPPQSLGLGSSVLPSGGGSCSIVSLPSQARTCSAFQQGQRCSALCDSLADCSAFEGAAGGDASCSTHAQQAVCSVLQPQVNPPVGGARCSTFGPAQAPGQLACSVFGLGRRQACSAENDPQAGTSASTCSTIRAQGGFCSVLNPGTQRMSFCSTGFAGSKSCSTIAGPAQCSVLLNGRGICSHFKGAPQGSCSALAGGHCSVIGGSSGNRCRRG